MMLIRVDNSSAININQEMCGEASAAPCPGANPGAPPSQRDHAFLALSHLLAEKSQTKEQPPPSGGTLYPSSQPVAITAGLAAPVSPAVPVSTLLDVTALLGASTGQREAEGHINQEPCSALRG